MNAKPRLLDLFCGGGGAAMGYHRAGFEVIGVDLAPQPHYPFEFHQADALTYSLDGFDAIHASPPCQAFSDMKIMGNAREHFDLLTPIRNRLRDWGGIYVIENVEGAPLEAHPPSLFSPYSGVVLCGSMFGLRNAVGELRRHRLFECSISLPQPSCHHGRGPVVGFYGDHARLRRRSADGGDIVGNAKKMPLVKDLMGIDWMPWERATQAIPPAYAEFIGGQLLSELRAAS